MSENSSKNVLLLLSFLSVALVLGVDLFMFTLKSPSQGISHLGMGVLIAQLISLLVFYKGEICPGQRERLIKANSGLVLYWSIWLIISLLPGYNFTLTTVMSVCGLSISYFIWKQPQSEKLRNSFLLMGELIAGFGLLSGLMIFRILPINQFVEYNPVALILSGIILANLFLVIAKSRLQQFIALLPLVMITFLLLNALVMFIVLVINGLESAVSMTGILAYAIYFMSHLFIAIILMIHSFKKWTLTVNTLFILLFVSCSLPIWMSFI